MDQVPGLGVSLGLSNVSEAQTSKIVNGDSGLHDLYSLVTVNQRGRPPQPHHGGRYRVFHNDGPKVVAYFIAPKI